MNSQSGKGGVAYILKAEHKLDLPRRAQIEFSRVVQERTDADGGEMSADAIWEVFSSEYLHRETPLQLACRNRYVDGVRRLLELKADPNAKIVTPKERFSHVRSLLDTTSPGFYTYDRFDLPTGNPRDDALAILRMLFNCGLDPDESCRCRLFRVDPRARVLLEKKSASVSRDRKRRSIEQSRGFRGAFGLQRKRR